jgi:hypothetical protein
MAQEIEHTHLPIRGLNIHVAQVGKGESSAQTLLAGRDRLQFHQACDLFLVDCR